MITCMAVIWLKPFAWLIIIPSHKWDGNEKDYPTFKKCRNFHSLPLASANGLK